MIADHDDPDALALRDSGALDDSHWLKLGLTANDYRIDIGDDESWFGSQDLGVSSSDLVGISKIVYRRWRVSPPSPPVRVSELADAARLFAEREWASAVDLLLHSWYVQAGPSRWSRPPWPVSDKQSIMRQISELVRVPRWRVTNTPEGAAHTLVTKSVSLDQSFEPDWRSSTVLLDEDLNGIRQCAPILMQDYVCAQREVRLTFAYGVTGQVIQRSGGIDPVDVRFAATGDRRAQKDALLDEQARAISRTLGLEVFTADILVDSAGQCWWIDINPDGLSIACDDDEGTLLGALAEGLRSTGNPRSGPSCLLDGYAFRESPSSTGLAGTSLLRSASLRSCCR